MQSSRTADAIIIGAGAVGCAVALQFARAGISPIVIERDAVAFNASGYAWGGLSAHFGAGVPGPMTDIYRQSIAKHIETYEEITPKADNDWQLQPVTSMSLVENEIEADRLDREVQWMRLEGFDAEMINASDIYLLEPAIRPGMIAASLVNAGWELDSYRYTKALASEAERLGAVFVKGEVSSVASNATKFESVMLGDSEIIHAPIVVAATGPWTRNIGGMPTLPIKPIKGEILRLTRPGNDLQNRVGFGGFNVGRKPDGSVWAGTYEWDRGFDRAITEEGRRHILNGVTGYLPSLKDAEITTSTACLRPVTSDGIPIVGASGVVNGLYYANGAGKKGILLSPIIAEWLTALVADGNAPPELVSPSRFDGI